MSIQRQATISQTKFDSLRTIDDLDVHLEARLDKARQEIASGNCVTCKTQGELDNFLASL